MEILDEVLGDVELDKNKRGRPPKHSKKKYLKILIIKEYKKRSLRAMETDYSRLICEERVDHSLIHYSEN